MNTPDPGRDDEAAFTLLYVSELAAGGAVEIDQICRQSRANNQRDGITGVLVFDGHAFCQLVEGSESAIAALRDRLEGDSRHRDMRVLRFGRAPWPRRFTSWRLGYAYTAEPAAIARIADRRGADAVVAFRAWLPALAASDELPVGPVDRP
jgi:Sensors of blue-light using FAD